MDLDWEELSNRANVAGAIQRQIAARSFNEIRAHIARQEEQEELKNYLFSIGQDIEQIDSLYTHYPIETCELLYEVSTEFNEWLTPDCFSDLEYKEFCARISSRTNDWMQYGQANWPELRNLIETTNSLKKAKYRREKLAKNSSRIAAIVFFVAIVIGLLFWIGEHLKYAAARANILNQQASDHAIKSAQEHLEIGKIYDITLRDGRWLYDFQVSRISDEKAYGTRGETFDLTLFASARQLHDPKRNR